MKAGGKGNDKRIRWLDVITGPNRRKNLGKSGVVNEPKPGVLQSNWDCKSRTQRTMNELKPYYLVYFVEGFEITY